MSIEWNTLYGLSLAGALGILAYRWQIVVEPIANIHSLTLFVLTVALLIYFWYWDTEKPGFKVKYPNHSIWVYLAATGVAISFVVTNILVLLGHPAFFLLGVSLIYFTKTASNGIFGRHITDRVDIALNLIAVFSDVVSAIIFAVYSVFSMVFVPDKSDAVFLGCVVIVGYVTIIAIEWYYQLVVGTLRKLTSSDSVTKK